MSENNRLSYNKGEWSELYVLLTVLGQGYINISSQSMETGALTRMTVDYVAREEIRGTSTIYRLTPDEVGIYSHRKFHVKISKSDFLKAALALKNDILAGSGPSFRVSENVYAFMESARIKQPKAKSIKAVEEDDDPNGGKCDITIDYRDPRTGKKTHGGFSIKSAFGHNATLFNASSWSSAVFELSNCTYQIMSAVNEMKKPTGANDILGRCEKLDRLGVGLIANGFKKDSNATSAFESNLRLVNSDLRYILPELIKQRFFTRNHLSAVDEITDILVNKNPCNVANPKIYYPTNIKSFLFAAFSGLTASHPWNGFSQPNGGYILIDKDWSLKAALVTDADEFRKYLFKSTKIDNPSSKRYPYGYIYKNGDCYYFDLNFQIRFTC